MSETFFERLTNEQNPIIKCPSCGAEFDIHANYCPYCGHANEYGQESAYMDHLESIEDDLERMGDYAENEVKKEVGSTLKKVLIPVLTIIGIIIIIAILLSIRSSFVGRSSIRKTMDWQTENLPKLNDMYEAGDFDALAQEMERIHSTNEWKVAEIYSWEHYNFYTAYAHYYFLRQTERDAIDSPVYVEKMKDFVFYEALDLIYSNYDTQLSNRLITEKDYKYIQEYREYGKEFMKKHYGIDDLDSIAQMCQLEPPMIGFDLNKIQKIIDDYTWTD